MNCLGVSLLVAVSLIASAHSAGTVLELHRDPFFGGPPGWVVPDPTFSSPGSPIGCKDLPNGFTFQSGRFFWNATAGASVCHFIWFFYEKGCTGGARGVEIIPPPTDGSVWVSQDAIYARTTYGNIVHGMSVGCSFESDPCQAFPCSDPNALCNSTYGWSWPDASGKQWANQQRDCSACKPGYTLDKNGQCLSSTEVCASLNCPAQSKCVTNSSGAATCECPAELHMDPESNTCKPATQKAWLSALNVVRSQAAPSAAGLSKAAVRKAPPLAWDDHLAAVAKDWTAQLNSTQCGHDPVSLTKIPGGNYSESDVWVSWSSDEASAVQLWAPQPSDSANPRTARITDSSTRLAGCGKTICGAGAFFTCLFYPKTI